MDLEERFKYPTTLDFPTPTAGSRSLLLAQCRSHSVLEDQLKPYRSEVQNDPVAFVNSKLELSGSGSFSVQLLGRQPLRDVLKGFANWGWGLNWAGLEVAFAEGFMGMAFPTEADHLLFHVLSMLGFDEHSLKYDVNGLLSKKLEDDECNPCLLLSVGIERTTSASLSRDDARTRFQTFVETFQYNQRF